MKFDLADAVIAAGLSSVKMSVHSKVKGLVQLGYDEVKIKIGKLFAKK